MEKSALCLPRNFSCIAGLYGSLAEDGEEAAAAAAAAGPESRGRGAECEKQRSREGSSSSSGGGGGGGGSSNKNPSPGQRRRAKSLPAPGDRALSALSRASSKKVRFADSLGLELTTIRHFCDADVPQVPPRVMARLRERPAECPLSNRLVAAAFLDGPGRLLEPLFGNPGAAADFQQRVRKNRVCLESVCTDHFSVAGLVRVRNVAYEKQVLVRYSLDHWRSHIDLPASHSAHSADSQTDTFSFKLVAPVFLEAGGTLQFAIRYLVAGQEFWDNNRGSNYQVRSHKFKISPPKDWENGWIHFI